MATATTPDFANWDLKSYFPTFDGPEYRTFRDGLKTTVASIQGRARSLATIEDGNLDAWVRLLLDIEALTVDIGHLASYLGCLKADDARNETVLRENGALSTLLAEHDRTNALVLAAFKAVPDARFERLAADPRLADATYSIRRMREQAARTMSAELEELAAELGVTGFAAWGRLYDQVAGRLEFEMDRGGKREKVPMSLRVSLLENPDPNVRKAAFTGSNAAWEGMSHVVAACLNAIAGTRLALYKRRGVDHFLDRALFDSAITRKTLDAMMSAISRSYEIPRRYLRLKAKLMGKPKLGFQDLSAPLPLAEDHPVGWEDATRRIVDAFGGAYPAMGEFARMAFDKNWVESETRAGKSPGGFCTSSMRLRESRIFMTFNRTLGCVQTLAHELGHAYHNWVMRDLRAFARRYPMTLAETASTFAETLFTDAILGSPGTSPTEKAQILDTRLEGAAAFLLNIPMRFHFEKSFYEERAAGEVPVGRLKELLLAAQRGAYGDVLAEDEMDPWFWASKLHFYITGVSFYNFPYSFGYLFSLGVYSRAKKEGPSFRKKYEDLLRLTGRDTAEAVAKKALGIDLETPDFWLESIREVEADLSRFEAIVPSLKLRS